MTIRLLSYSMFLSTVLTIETPSCVMCSYAIYLIFFLVDIDYMIEMYTIVAEKIRIPLL